MLLRTLNNSFVVSGFVAIDDFCYAAVSETVSWSAANEVCRSLHKDAQLVVVESAEKQEAVKVLIANLGIRVSLLLCGSA